MYHIASAIVAEKEAEKSQTASYIIYFLTGILEILLLFRFVFRLMGANPVNGFVNIIYTLSQILILPFAEIFHQTTASGAEVTAVFEPSTLIAVIVYALLAWGTVKLIKILSV